MLREAIDFWSQQPDVSALKPHLRSAVIQSFEFTTNWRCVRCAVCWSSARLQPTA